MREYVEVKCKTLTGDQRKQLAVTMDDIVFLLPEDVSVVFDEEGRFWPVLHVCQWRLVELTQLPGCPCLVKKHLRPLTSRCPSRPPLQVGSSVSSS